MLENQNLLKASLARFNKYEKWLSRQPVSAQTRRAYLSRVQGFLGYLGVSGEDLAALISNDSEREFVLKEYKLYLKKHLKMLPAGISKRKFDRH